MSKSPTTAQAAARARAAERRRVVDAERRQQQRVAAAEEQLRAIARRLEALELERAGLMATRDAAVGDLRAAGYSWGRLAAMAGTTRAALIQRRASPEPSP